MNHRFTALLLTACIGFAMGGCSLFHHHPHTPKPPRKAEVEPGPMEPDPQPMEMHPTDPSPLPVEPQSMESQ